MKSFKVVCLVLILVAILSLSTKTYAQELMMEEESISTDTPKVEKINYNMPYPGLLPGNPLYNLKVLRDKIVSTLISDSLKKASFDLLASDKRANAATFLFDKNKNDIAIDTLSKSNNYFDDAIVNIEKAKKMNEDIQPLLEQMKQSIRKHQEIISPYEKKLSGKNKKALTHEIMRMKKFEKSVNNLFPHSK